MRCPPRNRTNLAIANLRFYILSCTASNYAFNFMVLSEGHNDMPCVGITLSTLWLLLGTSANWAYATAEKIVLRLVKDAFLFRATTPERCSQKYC